MHPYEFSRDERAQDAAMAAPVITPAEAVLDRAGRARRQAANCVILAVVTPPSLAADLIDRAIAHAREAGNASGSQCLIWL